jgi:hypothetical protein
MKIKLLLENIYKEEFDQKRSKTPLKLRNHSIKNLSQFLEIRANV